ncbi:hypothetical protein GCM10009839_87670 [Catenulispora yoronensis]|uniref:Uncharacterized protein n=1 Tax=Catenulispora yoronensis TaxID=450799 RepID=A0ABN2VIE5_9ACTN
MHTQPDFIISSAITTLDETATPTLWHEFPDKEVTNQELGLEYILSFDAPRLPDVDFEVGAWLSYYGLAPHTGFEPVRLRSKGGVTVAFRWHRGDLVRSYAFQGLDDAVNEADFSASRIDKATYRRRHLEIHRVKRPVVRAPDRT